MKTMKGLIEGLGFMNTVLGGQSDIIDVDLTGFDVEDDPIAVPTVAKALTAVVHKSFSKAADDMMIAGHLSQEQRIALSHCISAALQAFTAEAEENCTWALDQIIDDEMAARFMESK